MLLVSNINYANINCKHKSRYLVAFSSETNYSYVERLEKFNVSAEVEIREIQMIMS